MRLSALLVSFVASGFLVLHEALAADDSAALGIKAPEGFEVSLFAGDELAHDIYSMTIDSHGRIVVAGAGYVRILHDDNRDGKADRATLFSSKPASGAHGMFFVGDDLICTGDNSLMKLRDNNGDGVADGEPEIWATLKHSEHGANGIVQGPDGWIYVACGNDAGVTADHATPPTSPVKNPEAGAILRFSPDGKNSEIFAHGFRNIYDLDFNAFGQLFTVDSDGERDHHLPWYAPTRLFDVAEGMHHGWVLQGHQRSWNRPAYFPDVAPRLAEIGRGSPTGVVVYRHVQFPEEYRGDVFSACWTLGRVYRFSSLEKPDRPISYVSDHEIFLRTTGETGFAPVDLAVGPDGAMFVAVGGRGTRGSVFRVSFRGQTERIPKAGGDLEDVLMAPQPQAAWSLANWRPQALKLGRQPFVTAALDEERPLLQRLRALDVLRQLFDGITIAECFPARAKNRADLFEESLVQSVAPDADTLDGAVFLKNLTPSGANYWHAVRRAYSKSGASAKEILGGQIESEFLHPFTSRLGAKPFRAVLAVDASHQGDIEGLGLTSLWRLHARGRLTPSHFDAAAQCFMDADDPADRLPALRLMQLSLGDVSAKPQASDVYAGYTLGAVDDVVQQASAKWGKKLADHFPAFDREANLELARILGMLQVADEAMIDRMSSALINRGEDEGADQFHYLIVLSRLPGPRSSGATKRIANAVRNAMPKSGTSRNWPLRFGETVKGLIQHDPALAKTLTGGSGLPEDGYFRYFRGGLGRPWHWMIATQLSGSEREAANANLLFFFADHYRNGESIARWPEEIIPLIGEVQSVDAFRTLRKGWVSIHLQDAIIRELAKKPTPEDREKFVESLSSVQPIVVEAAAKALAKLDGHTEEQELTSAFAALRQNCLAIENQPTREALVALLTTWTRQDFKIEEPKEQKKILAAYKPWFDWLEKEHPAIAKKVGGFGDATTEEWLARLKKVDWAGGDEQRGLAVFQKKACHKCHAGNGPLGPNLAGAAARFSRDDLFGAIVDPHKEVAPPYQTTQIATSSGKVYSGLIVYESPDATLVQTTPDTTIRIAGDEILSMKKGRVSLMPSGLLNDASDQNLADLYSYLKTVKNVK